MATAHLRGEERFEYTPPGGSSTLHLLGIPLQERVPVDVRTRFEWRAADKRARNVVVVGDGAQDLLVTIRCDNEPAPLKAMLRAALEDDVTVNYRRTAAGTVYPLQFVEIVGAAPDEITIQPDRDRAHMGEYECRLRVRRVDGGTLDGLL